MDENLIDNKSENINTGIQIENREIEAVFCEPLELLTENLVDISEFNANEFKKGIDEVSKECGMFTAYINAGMSNVQAYELILTKLTLDYQKDVNNVTNKANIEIAKHQSIITDKNQL